MTNPQVCQSEIKKIVELLENHAWNLLFGCKFYLYIFPNQVEQGWLARSYLLGGRATSLIVIAKDGGNFYSVNTFALNMFHRKTYIETYAY